MVTFEIDKNTFLSTLNKLKITIKGKGKRALSKKCDITILDGYISCAVPNAVFKAECDTKGMAKVNTSLLYLISIVENHNEPKIMLEIAHGEIKIGSFTFAANTTIIEDYT